MDVNRPLGSAGVEPVANVPEALTPKISVDFQGRDCSVNSVSTEMIGLKKQSIAPASGDRRVSVASDEDTVSLKKDVDACDGKPQLIKVEGQLTAEQQKNLEKEIDQKDEWTPDEKQKAKGDVKKVAGFFKSLARLISKNILKIVCTTFFVALGVTLSLIPGVGAPLLIGGLMFLGVGAVFILGVDMDTDFSYMDENVDKKETEDDNVSGADDELEKAKLLKKRESADEVRSEEKEKEGKNMNFHHNSSYDEECEKVEETGKVLARENNNYVVVNNKVLRDKSNDTNPDLEVVKNALEKESEV
ncbi:MAG: hypothetical protein KAG53_05725 [Endozoicomonadaceae bacterium]|nr:hypothetical protein [Endozoicomonadaceae bacterium]